MDTAQWPQEIVVKPTEERVEATNTTSSITTCSLKQPSSSSSSLEIRRARPHRKEEGAAGLKSNCPRCNSSNTKFCYYNNYSLSQPRYFCKTCRRYWTEGGSLRSIPVGGGSRKNNKISSSSSFSQSSSNKKLIPADLVLAPQPTTSSQNPNDDAQDLNLGCFPSTNTNDFKTISELIQVPNFYVGNNNDNNHQIPISSTSSANNNSSSDHLSALELLTGINSTSRGLINSFMPIMPPNNITDIPNSSRTHVYSSGFPTLTDQFKPSLLSFSVDDTGLLGSRSATSTGYGSLQGLQETSGRLLFPFEDLKQQHQVTNNATTDHDDSDAHNIIREHNEEYSNGYWNGMLGGAGSSW